MRAESIRRDIRAALHEIIEGKNVKRSRHELKWNTVDISSEFITALQEAGYHQMVVEDVDVEPGERVPAFYIDGGVTYFGWVFWEKFSELRLRKLFGSVVRNAKGDWAVQISGKRRSMLFVNSDLKSEMDMENPSAF